MAKKPQNEEIPAMTETTNSESPAASVSPKERTPRSKKPKSKTAAFNSALEALGTEAKPLEIQQWILQQYGMNLKTSLLSTYKSNWLRKHRSGGASGMGTRTFSVRVGKPGSKGDATLHDIRTLRELVDRVGPTQFKEMLDLLGIR
jgi:hypothetical protein